MITKSNEYITLPKFRKNIYTHEVIKSFLELINTGEKTIQQIVSEYDISRGNIYRWRRKYGSLKA
ncbi:helix-turn-helix domain-containing protein [uncultured Chryseobacterium sp.]|uniref:helix-turn-helix domain-containing protein n=1 Tax=uncultured Chryseobacterium sp. TaxID=259322 RepID=UPI0033905EE6